MIEAWLTGLATLMADNTWIAPLIVLGAGVLSSLMPCSLSTIPLIIGYVGGTDESNVKKSFTLSLVFALGSALTFTLLGIGAATLGRILSFTGSIWTLALGILMVLMALQIWEIFEFIPSSYLVNLNKKTGKLGAFLAGILSGLFASPCSTPILIVVLGLVAQGGNILWGGLLLLLYAVGHSFVVILVGTSMGWVNRMRGNAHYERINQVVKILLGLFVLAIGLYLLYLGI